MDTGKAALVICLTLIIVIGVNAAIYASLRNRSTVGQIEMLRRAVRRARNPWEHEDNDLLELSRRVAALKGESMDEEGGETAGHDR